MDTTAQHVMLRHQHRCARGSDIDITKKGLVCHRINQQKGRPLPLTFSMGPKSGNKTQTCGPKLVHRKATNVFSQTPKLSPTLVLALSQIKLV